MHLLNYFRYLKLNSSLTSGRYLNLFRPIFLFRPRKILEIGTYTGENALRMIQAASIFTPANEIEYFGFDLFEMLTDDLLRKEASLKPTLAHASVLEKLKKTNAKIYLFQGDTKETLAKAKDKLGTMDLIFVDGGHSFETIDADWNNIKNLINEKTLVIFDDYYLSKLPKGEDRTGCQKLASELDKNIYDAKLLLPTDTYQQNWGQLEIAFFELRLRANKIFSTPLASLLIFIEPILLLQLRLLRKIKDFVNRYLYWKFYFYSKKIGYLLFQMHHAIFKRQPVILFNRYAGLGDILLATAAIRVFKTRHPGYKIMFDTSDAGKEILADNPDIAGITVKKYHSLLKTAGWSTKLIYHHYPGLHIIDSYLKFLGIKPDTIDPKYKKPILILSDADNAFADSFLQSNGLKHDDLIIGIHAHSNFTARDWPIDNFEKIAQHFIDKYGAKIIELGTENKLTNIKGLSFAAKCSIRQSAAIIKRCAIVICNDSFVLHLPLVGIFGQVPPALRLPFNDMSFGCYPQSGCRGCATSYKDRQELGSVCGTGAYECVISVTKEQVISAVENTLNRLDLLKCIKRKTSDTLKP